MSPKKKRQLAARGLTAYELEISRLEDGRPPRADVELEPCRCPMCSNQAICFCDGTCEGDPD